MKLRIQMRKDCVKLIEQGPNVSCRAPPVDISSSVINPHDHRARQLVAQRLITPSVRGRRVPTAKPASRSTVSHINEST